MVGLQYGGFPIKENIKSGVLHVHSESRGINIQIADSKEDSISIHTPFYTQHNRVGKYICANVSNFFNVFLYFLLFIIHFTYILINKYIIVGF